MSAPKPAPNFRWAVQYSPDDMDVHIWECFEAEGPRQTEGAEAQLRDYLTCRYHTYGNREFTVYRLGEGVQYESFTETRVRAKR